MNKGVYRVWLLVILLCSSGIVNAKVTCADVDDRLEDKTTTPRTFSSIRSNMTKGGWYCDLAINWPIDASSWNNVTRNNGSLAKYQKIYATVTSDSTYPANLDQDRMAGINRDCLASLYTILCASAFPYCDSTSGTENPGLCKASCELLQYRCPTLTSLYNELCSENVRETNCATCNLFFGSFLLSVLLSLSFVILQ